MKTFDCDFDIKHESEQVSRLTVSTADSEGTVCISVMDNYRDLQSIEVVRLNPSKARELAAELSRLADELDGVYRHDEIRGTMPCSSLAMPINPRP